MGGMACVSTPSIRNLITTESSRVSMWMSEARRCSAVKIVVSTSRMMGLVSPGAGQLVDGKGFFRAGGFVFADDLEAFAGFFQHALRLLGLLQDVVDLLQGRDFGDNPLLQQQADFVDHHQLAGIGDRNRQPAVGGLFQRNELVAEHQFGGEFLEQLVMKLEVGEVDELAAIAARDVLRAFQVGDGIARRRPSARHSRRSRKVISFLPLPFLTSPLLCPATDLRL